MIPTNPDWQQIARSLVSRYGSDDRTCDELSRHGVILNRSAIYRLRSGEYSEPRSFAACAAMLNLYHSTGDAK